jgi:Tol biopolymer transport system component
MKLGKLLLSIVIVSLIVSMAIPLAAAPKPPDKPGGGGKPPKDEPPADPAICYRRANTLYVMNADGSNQVVVYQADSIGNPKWAPDGSAIAFIMQQEDYTYDLYRIDVSLVNGQPQGSNLYELVQDVGMHTPAWSPGGDEIAFVQKIDGVSRLIQTVPATGGTVETIYNGPGDFWISGLAWRGDGLKLAFYGNTLPGGVNAPGGPQSIVVLDLSYYSTTTVYGPTTDWFAHIDWARNSDILVMQTSFGIAILDITETNPTPQTLIESTASLRFPTWSPDDSQIAYLRPGKGRSSEIVIYTLATEETEILAKGFAPDWCRA